jgi:hypothetical protein
MLKTITRLYETDFAAWAETTAQSIRQEQFQEVDWQAVAEEIESLGRSDRRELKSPLEVLLQHLLKWQYQPERRSGSWRNTIDEQRHRLEDLLADSPSLKPYLAEVTAECYRRGRKAASNETGLPLNKFPIDCHYTIEQILDPEFLPKTLTNNNF